MLLTFQVIGFTMVVFYDIHCMYKVYKINQWKKDFNQFIKEHANKPKHSSSSFCIHNIRNQKEVQP